MDNTAPLDHVRPSDLILPLSEQDVAFAGQQISSKPGWLWHLAVLLQLQIVSNNEMGHHELEFIRGEETSGADKTKQSAR